MLGAFVGRSLRVLFTPAVIFWPFVVIGAALWAAPPRLLGGFGTPEAVRIERVAILMAWYGGISMLALAGSFAGRKVRSLDAWSPRQETFFYAVLSAVAAAGVSFTWMQVLRRVSIMDVISTQQANELKDALYADYQAGLYTLRFAAAPAAGIAIYRMMSRGRPSVLDLANCVLVAAAAAISARMLLIQACFFGIFLLVSSPHGLPSRSTVSVWKMGVLALAAAGIVVAYTFSRSAGTYRTQGVEGAAAMTYVEVKRYLGAPIQVSLGTAGLLADGRLAGAPRREAPLLLLPTFLAPDELKRDDSGNIGYQWYLPYIDISPNLTKNSAFADLLGYLRYWGILYVGLVAFVASVAFGWLSRGGLPSRLMAGVVLYAFAELWRLFYFNSGSFIFMLLAVGGAGSVSLLVRRRFQPWT